jgi:hypothetical protein
VVFAKPAKSSFEIEDIAYVAKVGRP